MENFQDRGVWIRIRIRFCPERLDPDPDPVNIRPDPQPLQEIAQIQELISNQNDNTVIFKIQTDRQR